MKHTKFALGLALILSVFMLTGCPGSLKSEITVTFIDNGDELKTLNIHPGDVIDTYDLPYTPYKSYNDFLYWSESTASLAAAVEFDLTKPITKSVTLHAIYTPQIDNYSYNGIEVSATSITFELKGKNVFPLDDGSFAGLSASDYVSGIGSKDLKLNIPAKNEIVSSDRVLTYKIDPPLSEGEHMITIRDQSDSYIKYVTVAKAKAVSHLTAEVEDSKAVISFDHINGWKYYTVEAYWGNTLVASQTIEANLSLSLEEKAYFYGLINGQEYTFKVFTDGSDKYDQITATPVIQKKDTDWLMVMYMDGDNNLHDQIYLDMNEVEFGLSKIQKSSGDPIEGFDKVKVVALWDGAVSWQGTDENGKPATVTPQIGPSGTYLYEMGIQGGTWDDKLLLNGSSCNLSYNTKNLTYTAKWLVPQVIAQDTSTTDDIHGEVNMGHAQTLVNFLKWATDHYNVNKGIILQFSDHGGGPRSVRYVQTKDGRTIKVGDTSGRRALCWDESSNSSFLKTKDVSYALDILGFGKTKPQLAMILMDVCLGSSIEDAYQFKNYAQYLAASPNTIPGSGLDYKTLFTVFKTDDEIENHLDKLGKHILEGYREQYLYSGLWDSLIEQKYGKPYDELTSEQQNAAIQDLSIWEWLSDYGMTTFTITDLSKMDEVRKAIDNMCGVLLDCEADKKDFVRYLGQHHANVVNLLNNETGNYYVNDTMYYQGTYTWLYDIGYIADKFKALSAEMISGNPNENPWSALNSAADALSKKLGEAIICSWRDSPFTDYQHDFYSEIDKNSENNYQHHYGLTICGSNIATDGEALTQGTAPNWYKTDLEFGKDSRWGDLLAFWFNN